MFEQYSDLLTIKEVARELRRDEWSARQLCRENKLPHVKIGQRILIPKDLLIAFIEEKAAASVKKAD